MKTPLIIKRVIIILKSNSYEKKYQKNFVLFLILFSVFSCSTSKNVLMNKSKLLDFRVENTTKKEILEKINVDNEKYKNLIPRITPKGKIINTEGMVYEFVPTFMFDEEKIKNAENFDNIEDFIIPNKRTQYLYGKQGDVIQRMMSAAKDEFAVNDKNIDIIRKNGGDSLVKKMLLKEKNKLPHERWSFGLPMKIDEKTKLSIENALKNADNNKIFFITLRRYPYLSYYKNGKLVLSDRERVYDTEKIQEILFEAKKRLQSGIEVWGM